MARGRSLSKKRQCVKPSFAFIAPNGTGKTTLLRMIIWCLYGEETPGSTPSQEGKRLPLVNTKVLQQSETGAKVPVTVEIRF